MASLVAATNEWIQRYSAIPSTLRDRYPTAHDTNDDAGKPFFTASERAAIEGGAPYVSSLSNVLLFSGPAMRAYGAKWSEIKRLLSLTGFDSIGPTSDGASTVAEEIDHLKSIRDRLAAIKPPPLPTTPAAELPRNPPRRVGAVVIGLLVTAGVVYAATTYNR